MRKFKQTHFQEKNEEDARIFESVEKSSVCCSCLLTAISDWSTYIDKTGLLRFVALSAHVVNAKFSNTGTWFRDASTWS